MFTGDKFNNLKLKADLLVEGVDSAPDALEDVGVIYKEQNHGLFGWDFEDHPGMMLPDDFMINKDIIVQYRKNSRSPFLIKKKESGDLVLTKEGAELAEVDWIKRPDYYDMLTTKQSKMLKVGQVGGEDCLFFCYQNYCSYFSKHEECLFCNLVSTSKKYDTILKKKDIEDIGEVAACAFNEGRVEHVLLTGGCFNHEKEIEVVTSILEEIRKHTGMDRIPGTVLPSPAKTPEEIRKYYDAGINAIGFSMEIWDEKLFRAICPGKSTTISRGQFLESIENAVNIFGEGNVYAVFVMGLEPADTLLEGVRQITERGANTVPFVWSPNPGSKYEGHRAPFGSWFVETNRRMADIVAASGVPPGTGNHCYRCDGNSILHDTLRSIGVE